MYNEDFNNMNGRKMILRLFINGDPATQEADHHGKY